jgi:hypothetical protein
MQVRLDNRWSEKLARMPESGMGYQRVRVRLKAGRTIENALVFNGRILEVAREEPAFQAADIDEIELETQ